MLLHSNINANQIVKLSANTWALEADYKYAPIYKKRTFMEFIQGTPREVLEDRWIYRGFGGPVFCKTNSILAENYFITESKLVMIKPYIRIQFSNRNEELLRYGNEEDMRSDYEKISAMVDKTICIYKKAEVQPEGVSPSKNPPSKYRIRNKKQAAAAKPKTSPKKK